MALLPMEKEQAEWEDITSSITWGSQVGSTDNTFKLYKNDLGLLKAKGHFKLTVAAGETQIGTISQSADSALSVYRNGASASMSITVGAIYFYTTAAISNSSVYFG